MLCKSDKKMQINQQESFENSLPAAIMVQTTEHDFFNSFHAAMCLKENKNVAVSHSFQKIFSNTCVGALTISPSLPTQFCFVQQQPKFENSLQRDHANDWLFGWLFPTLFTAQPMMFERN